MNEGPFGELIIRVGPPNLPKGPIPINGGPIPSFGGAQRIRASRQPCIFSDQVFQFSGLSLHKILSTVLQNRPLPSYAGGFVVFLYGSLSLHLSVFLCTSAMIGLEKPPL